MSGRLVVKRYVKALFEIAEAEGKIGSVERDMAALDKILNEAPSIRKYCQKRHESISMELTFVKTAFIPYIGEYTQRLILTAVGNRRLAAIPLLSSAFKMLMDEKGDKAEVLVESAVKLEPGVIKQIKNKMVARTGKKVIMNTKILPEILGGFRIIWQNRIIDMSALGRLKRVRQLLK